MSSSIFSNSQNILITGGNITSHISRIEGSLNGLDRLRHHTTLGALLDSTERFDPPKCAAATRVSIINQILDWVADQDDESSLMWLYGPAGAGKSALAQTIAEMLRDRKLLIASFFFSRTAADRSDGRLLIATLSYQLTLSLPATQRAIRQCIEADPTIFDRANETQMERLLIAPINQFAVSWLNILSKWTSRYFGCFPAHLPRIIIIDGLDECQDPRIQVDLLRVIGESIENFKLPIKFLITSRPDSHILRVFNYDPTFQRLNIPTINLATDNDAHRDIRLFIQREFDEIKRTHPLRSYLPNSWPVPEAVRQLVRKSSGQFIYASTVIRYIQSPKHRPDDRLNVVLGLSPAPSQESPFSQLDALYTHIFSSVECIDPVMQIFGVLVIPRNKGDALGNYTTPRTLERLLFLRPGDVLLILGDLLSIVTIGGPDSPIKITHASLADYFLDPSRSGRFFVDLSLVHSTLARGYLRRISNIISLYNFNPLDLQSAITPFISHCLKASLTKELQKDLMKFDFMTVWRLIIARHKSWLVLNPFYMWFLVTSLVQLFSRENFKDLKSLRVHFTDQLDGLNVYLALQLKSSVIDNYIPRLLSLMYIEDLNSNFQISATTTQYLSLLCQLFSWDYNSAFTADLHLRYAQAVKQCLKFVGDNPEFADLKRLYRQFPALARFDHRLEEAHLNCAIALLPNAGYLSSLVEHMKTFNFSSFVLTCHHEKAAILSERIVDYMRLTGKYHELPRATSDIPQQ